MSDCNKTGLLDITQGMLLSQITSRYVVVSDYLKVCCCHRLPQGMLLSQIITSRYVVVTDYYLKVCCCHRLPRNLHPYLIVLGSSN